MMTIARLEWLILSYMKIVHKPDLNNATFFILENTTLGQVLQLDAIDRKQIDVMISYSLKEKEAKTPRIDWHNILGKWTN